MDTETGKLIDISTDIAEILKIVKGKAPFDDVALLPLLDHFRIVGADELPPSGIKRKNAVKYVALSAQTGAILSGLSDSFRLVERDGEAVSHTILVYCDTPDFRIFHDHLNGKLNRIKIRARSSGNDGLDFLEIWQRKNRGGMVRKKYPLGEESLEYSANQVLMSFSPELGMAGVLPVLVARFNRLVLLRDDGNERITVDTGLEFFKPDGTGPLRSYRNLAFLEMRKVKNGPSYLDNILKDNNIRKQRSSKYCLGVTALYPCVKANAYKPVIRNIENIISNGYV